MNLCFAAREDQAVEFRISIESFPSGRKIYTASFRQDAGNSWRRLQRVISIRNMDAQDDAIKFKWEGKDTQYWRGNYGAKVANISLKFVYNPETLVNSIDII
jgi:hypothetical protein